MQASSEHAGAGNHSARVNSTPTRDDIVSQFLGDRFRQFAAFMNILNADYRAATKSLAECDDPVRRKAIHGILLRVETDAARLVEDFKMFKK